MAIQWKTPPRTTPKDIKERYAREREIWRKSPEVGHGSAELGDKLWKM